MLIMGEGLLGVSIAVKHVICFSASPLKAVSMGVGLLFQWF